MLSNIGVRSMIRRNNETSFADDFDKEEHEFSLRERRRQEINDRERELHLFRSGSAPPSVEGSFVAIGGILDAYTVRSEINMENTDGFLTEEEIICSPAYSSFYYSQPSPNPRLPQPAISKENWRSAQRIQASDSVIGGIGDRRKLNRGEEDSTGSLFSSQPGFNSQVEEHGKLQASGEWFERERDGLIGLEVGKGAGQNRIANLLQDDLDRPIPLNRLPSRPSSRNAFDNGVEKVASTESHLSHLNRDIAFAEEFMSNANIQGIVGAQNIGTSSHLFHQAVGSSLSRSMTPDPQLIARVPTPSLPPVGEGRFSAKDKRNSNNSSPFNGMSSNTSETTELISAFPCLNLSSNDTQDKEIHLKSSIQQEIEGCQNFLFDLQGSQNNIKQHSFLKRSDSDSLIHPSACGQFSKPSYSDVIKKNGAVIDQSSLSSNGRNEMHKPITTNSYTNVSSTSPITSTSGPVPPYRIPDISNSSFSGSGLSGRSVNTLLPSLGTNHIIKGKLHLGHDNAAMPSSFSAANVDSRVLGGVGGSPLGPNFHTATDFARLSNQIVGSSPQMPHIDPLYLQFLRSSEYQARIGAGYVDPSMDRNYLSEVQKAYLGALLSQQKSQQALSYSGSSGLNNGYYNNPAFGIGGSYPGSPLANSIPPASSIGNSSPIRHNENIARFPSSIRDLDLVGSDSPIRHNENITWFASGIRNLDLAGGLVGSWHPRPENGGNISETHGSSLLEEFKNNKTRCLELREIAGDVVGFSADQYGSRFIQQKLESATVEEKNMVFQEIIPEALSLMTDVFGNYVIQKFFEYGTPEQRRELANKLNGNVLTLSLQMYGCRVIQKAIEVVDLDQQIRMVTELDGHVMRCVRDQNGNHVIQKCIECIPQDAILFIISAFHEQVVTLSTHPYGCRVIQRVLEHCNDPQTQEMVMDEILNSVCMLAQDQYGNYVVQHVLEHGKPHERSSIIKKLAGQIVQMSQQKFASNVVEKCLTFGGPEERQILVNEMLGTTDENEPLQAMMKDQFANYVVQKVLETCDDHQRELILSRIKVHLTALKKYTYGKHIVARVEKLVATGERRSGNASSFAIPTG